MLRTRIARRAPRTHPEHRGAAGSLRRSSTTPAASTPRPRRCAPTTTSPSIAPPFNLGHQRAIVFGLRLIEPEIGDDDLVVTMDADGEDRPEDLPALLAAVARRRPAIAAGSAWRAAHEAHRVVALPGACTSSSASLFRTLTGVTVRNGNYAAYRGWLARRMLQHPYFDLCYSSTLVSLDIPVTPVPIPRGTRYAGQSRMNLFRLFMHGIRMLTPFTDRIAIRAMAAFTAIFALGVLASLAVRRHEGLHLGVDPRAGRRRRCSGYSCSRSSRWETPSSSSPSSRIHEGSRWPAWRSGMTEALEAHLRRQIEHSQRFFWHRLRWRVVRSYLPGERRVRARRRRRGRRAARHVPRSATARSRPTGSSSRSNRCVQFLRERYGDARRRGRRRRLRRGRFVTLLDVLEHQQDDRAFLSALVAKMAPGSTLLLTVPALPSLWSQWDVALGHFRRYDKATLLACTRRAAAHRARDELPLSRDGAARHGAQATPTAHARSRRSPATTRSSPICPRS